uniref:Uncharacterized protein n=1 Tax=Anguilla anguilla TaxID=7936 RepID=A0A0E9X4Z8_ANGAN
MPFKLNMAFLCALVIWKKKHGTKKNKIKNCSITFLWLIGSIKHDPHNQIQKLKIIFLHMHVNITTVLLCPSNPFLLIKCGSEQQLILRS